LQSPARRKTAPRQTEHFSDKRGLFAAVCEEVERAWVEEIVAEVGAEPDPRRRLEMGCEAYLDSCLDPGLQRILIVDAPAVLGLEASRGLEAHFGLGLLVAAFDDAIAAGYLEEQPTEPLARLIMGALNEAGLTIAQATDPGAARSQLGASVARIIEGLRPQSPRSPLRVR
jgi:AcrR family transcriptional regulator